jgi:2,4-dienoyl-CoA reductase-like NADH-dependent reductase (Old Yellow Enzyme family)
MSVLFTPFRVGALELVNRIVIAPMCQYSAVNGCMTDWHVIHLGHLALSGAALLTIEASAVLPEGRITYGDVGLWNDATEAAIARTLESIRRWSDIPIAIQLAHAGRKASTELPWKGGVQIPADQPNGWQTVAPSAIPYEDGDRPPVALDQDHSRIERRSHSGPADPVGPSYQVPLARAVKKATRMPVIAVGLITEFEQAEAIVGTGDADLIALARTILYNPRWPWHAAAHFGARVKVPDQYLRSQPRQYPDLFDIGH